MSPEKCMMPRCRQPIHLILRGMPLCEKHWDERCAKDHEAHKVKVEKVELGSAATEEDRQALLEIAQELKLL